MAGVDLNGLNYENAFLAYGTFKPNQVSFSLIEDCVENDYRLPLQDYRLLHRNGMPMIEKNEGYTTSCYLLKFKEGCAEKAYNRISKSRSNSLFEWTEININSERVNCLIAKRKPDPENPRKCKSLGDPYHSDEYDGKDDLGFYRTLDFIESNLKETHLSNIYQDEFLFLQMNYMLLWAVIDKYMSLRYVGWGQMINVRKLSKEPALRDAIDKYVQSREQPVYSSRGDQEFDLNVEQKSNKGYENMMSYYYHMRCNIVHGGKVIYQNSEPVKLAIEELLKVMRYILNDAFNIAQQE